MCVYMYIYIYIYIYIYVHTTCTTYSVIHAISMIRTVFAYVG